MKHLAQLDVSQDSTRVLALRKREPKLLVEET